MPYYSDINLLFIHIPKTAGTVIEGEIKKKYNQTLYSGRSNNILPTPYNSKSLQHQFYITLFKYREILKINFNTVKMFSVVRNPYNRIISDLFFKKLIKKNWTSQQVYNVIKNKYLNRDDLDNHNQPQYKFITDENCKLIPDIRIFKCETLNSNDHIDDFLGFKIDVIRKNVNKDYSKYLNNKSISLINNFYKKDFELFGYELKECKPIMFNNTNQANNPKKPKKPMKPKNPIKFIKLNKAKILKKTNLKK